MNRTLLSKALLILAVILCLNNHVKAQTPQARTPQARLLYEHLLHGVEDLQELYRYRGGPRFSCNSIPDEYEIVSYLQEILFNRTFLFYFHQDNILHIHLVTPFVYVHDSIAITEAELSTLETDFRSAMGISNLTVTRAATRTRGMSALGNLQGRKANVRLKAVQNG